MAEIVKKEKVNVKGNVVSIGIDVHKVSWKITAIVEGFVVLSVTSRKLKPLLDLTFFLQNIVIHNFHCGVDRFLIKIFHFVFERVIN